MAGTYVEDIEIDPECEAELSLEEGSNYIDYINTNAIEEAYSRSHDDQDDYLAEKGERDYYRRKYGYDD